MATAAVAYERPALAIPTNQGGGPRDRLLFDGERQDRIQSMSIVRRDDDGKEEIEVGEIFTIPAGTKMLVTVPRLCGDWYCEIDGSHHVAATGETQAAAVSAAIAKAV